MTFRARHGCLRPRRHPDGSAWTALILTMLTMGCASDFSDLLPPTVDEDPTLPAMEISGTRLHLETHGVAGNPVVIGLHGGPGNDYRSLLPLAKLADEGYFVVLWDQRGSGLSRRHSCDQLTADDYLRDLETLVETFAPGGDRPVFFVGHSWGAMYATWFIDRHPGRVQGAVLIEPGGFTKADIDDYFARLIGSLMFTEVLNDVLWSGRFLTLDHHARADLMAAAMFGAARRPLGMRADDPMPYWRAGGFVSTCLPASAGDFDWTTRLSEHPGEVLFIGGDRNTLIDRAHLERLAGHYPNAQLVTLPGAGHDVHWVAQDAFLAVTASYLQRRLAEGGSR